MRTMTHPVNGSTVTLYVPETGEDYNAALSWVASRPRAHLGLDTETTGLEVFSSSFAVRTVQVGTGSEAFVLRTGTPHGDAVIRAILSDHPRFIAHNAPFDLLALDAVGLARLDDLMPKVWDTYILAHLLDPRAAGEEGAVGLSLKSLSTVYVDPAAKDSQSALRDVFRSLGRRVSDGWDHPDLPHDETYLRYAGLDPVYTVRLMEAIGPMVKSMGMTKLANWEHEIQAVTTRMMHRGVLVDVPYTERLVHDLQEESERWAAVAARYGVGNVNSVAQVRDSLLAMGVDLREKTATGNLSVGKDVLLPLAGLTPYWDVIPDVDVNPLAEAVVKSKRAAKWKTAYAESFLSLRDSNDRIHPGIKSLAARTARMSVSNPPLQQLPAGDWRIRRALIADEGNVFISSDFAQIELRVLAANAQVTAMKEAIANGESLHKRTAALIWGPDYNKKQYGTAKSVNFLKVYGGGAGKLAKTAGLTESDARTVFEAFDKAYPEVRRYGNKLQRDATQDGWAVRTATGRRLPLSRERSYAATNYVVQSTARDLFAKSLLDVSRLPGMDSALSLVIHDEIITQVPTESAPEVAQLVADTMAMRYMGVPISAESEVFYGGSWGSGYGIPADADHIPAQHDLPEVVVQSAV